MFIEDLKPNSHKYKRELSEKKEVIQTNEPVAVGEKKQQSDLEKFLAKHILSDLIEIKSYAKKEMEKMIKRSAYNIFRYILDASFKEALPDENGRTPYRSFYSQSPFQSSPSVKAPEAPSRGSSHYVYDPIIYSSYGEADAVIDAMKNRCNATSQKVVLVADMCQFSRIVPETTDYKFGWDDGDMMGAKPIRTSDGRYYIRLPQPRQLAQ